MLSIYTKLDIIKCNIALIIRNDVQFIAKFFLQNDRVLPIVDKSKPKVLSFSSNFIKYDAVQAFTILKWHILYTWFNVVCCVETRERL